MTRRILLIDADMVAYRVAAWAEEPTDFGETFILSADPEKGRDAIDDIVNGWKEHLEAEAVVMTLSDSKENFRKTVLPAYKSNRDGIRRPMILGAMREHIETSYDFKVVSSLEADDVMGIMATHKGILRGAEKVMVTWDKDLRTIPGLHWNPDKDADGPPVVVTERQADDAFYAQCLSGDAVDGYSGCPGIGKVRAERIVQNRELTYPSERVLKSGPNKGETRIEWKVTQGSDPWECVVAQYEKAGLTEEDALHTARVARILRASDYNFKKKEPILWEPSN